MIRINLLPFRAARKKENIRQQASVFFLSFVLVCLGLFYANMILNGKLGRLKADIDVTKKELAGYQKINKEIAEIKKKLDVLNKKVDVIQGLEMNRKEPTQLLDAMTRVVVEKRMWFTSFTADGQNISIKGMALDNKTVADFMTRLENTKLFSSVSLKTLKQQKMKENLNLKAFDIICSRAKAAKPEAPAKT